MDLEDRSPLGGWETVGFVSLMSDLGDTGSVLGVRRQLLEKVEGKG